MEALMIASEKRSFRS